LENPFGAQAPWSLFFNFFLEIDILKFVKINKNTRTKSTTYYERVNFYYEIPCIVTLAKKTKWIKVGTCSQIWNLVPRSRFLLFLPRTKYKIFCNKILHTGRIKHRIRSGICFEFFQSSKFNFFEVWKKSSIELVLQIDALGNIWPFFICFYLICLFVYILLLLDLATVCAYTSSMWTVHWSRIISAAYVRDENPNLLNTLLLVGSLEIQKKRGLPVLGGIFL
jgi:hypothetical protein